MMPPNARGSTEAAGAREAGAPSRWLQIDAAAVYMGNVSRKTVYAAVAAGMRVARIGDVEPYRDARGRWYQGRMLFCTTWIDEFLEGRAAGSPLIEREVDAPNPLTVQGRAACVEPPIATRLQRAAENER